LSIIVSEMKRDFIHKSGSTYSSQFCPRRNEPWPQSIGVHGVPTPPDFGRVYYIE